MRYPIYIYIDIDIYIYIYMRTLLGLLPWLP